MRIWSASPPPTVASTGFTDTQCPHDFEIAPAGERENRSLGRCRAEITRARKSSGIEAEGVSRRGEAQTLNSAALKASEQPRAVAPQHQPRPPDGTEVASAGPLSADGAP